MTTIRIFLLGISFFFAAGLTQSVSAAPSLDPERQANCEVTASKQAQADREALARSFLANLREKARLETGRISPRQDQLLQSLAAMVGNSGMGLRPREGESILRTRLGIAMLHLMDRLDPVSWGLKFKPWPSPRDGSLSCFSYSQALRILARAAGPHIGIRNFSNQELQGLPDLLNGRIPHIRQFQAPTADSAEYPIHEMGPETEAGRRVSLVLRFRQILKLKERALVKTQEQLAFVGFAIIGEQDITTLTSAFPAASIPRVLSQLTHFQNDFKRLYRGRGMAEDGTTVRNAEDLVRAFNMKFNSPDFLEDPAVMAIVDALEAQHLIQAEFAQTVRIRALRPVDPDEQYKNDETRDFFPELADSRDGSMDESGDNPGENTVRITAADRVMQDSTSIYANWKGVDERGKPINWRQARERLSSDNPDFSGYKMDGFDCGEIVRTADEAPLRFDGGSINSLAIHSGSKVAHISCRDSVVSGGGREMTPAEFEAIDDLLASTMRNVSTLPTALDGIEVETLDLHGLRQAREREAIIGPLARMYEYGLSMEGIRVIRWIDMRGADARKAIVSRAYLHGSKTDEKTRLDDSNFDRTQFVSGEWRKTNAKNLSAAHANFRSMKMLGVDLSGGNAENSQWHDGSLQGSKLDGKNLARAKFIHMDLRGVSFVGANLEGAEFVNCQMSGAIFKDANMRGVKIEGQTEAALVIEGADFSSAQMRNAKVSKAQFNQCIFDGADLSSAVMLETRIIRTRMAKVKLVAAKISHGRMEEVMLDGSDLTRFQIRNNSKLKKIDLGFVTKDIWETMVISESVLFLKDENGAASVVVPRFASDRLIQRGAARHRTWSDRLFGRNLRQ